MCIFCERVKAQEREDAYGIDPMGFNNGSPSQAQTGSVMPVMPPVMPSTTKYGTISLSERLEAERCTVLQANRIPVSLVTGFLGSGKTTTINHLLNEQSDKRIAVLENEVGDVAIDDALLSGHERSQET